MMKLLSVTAVGLVLASASLASAADSPVQVLLGPALGEASELTSLQVPPAPATESSEAPPLPAGQQESYSVPVPEGAESYSTPVPGKPVPGGPVPGGPVPGGPVPGGPFPGQPIPGGPGVYPAPMPEQIIGPLPVDAGVELFPFVKYKDLHEMAPCAVPKIIRVPAPPCLPVDPCSACSVHDPCAQCTPKCVYIKICVPPCACEEVKVRRKGRRIRFCYGEHGVSVRIKKRHIEVDYQD